MTGRILRVLVAGALGALAPLAAAHELTCGAVASRLSVGADGIPLTTADGMPVPMGTPRTSLTVTAYPATIGVEVTLRNVASEPSVVTGVWDTLDSTGGAPAEQFPIPRAGHPGPAIGEGTTIPVGGSVVGWFAYEVRNQAECLRAFGGQVDAAVCTNDATDFRFVATHDVGSTECRARVVCGADEPAPPPVAALPPACPPTWHGVKQLGTSSYDAFAGIALDGDCNVDVVGSTEGSLGGGNHGSSDAILASLSAAGAVRQVVQWGGAGMDFALHVADDAAGDRWVTWSDVDSVQLTELDAAGAQVGTIVLTNPPSIASVSGTARGAAGDLYAVGNSGGTHATVVEKLAPDGSVQWMRAFGWDNVITEARGVAVDASGGVAVVSRVTTGVPGHPGFGLDDVLVARLDAAGNTLWVQLIGTASVDSPQAIAADAAGDVYVVGYTLGAFPGYANALGSEQAFVAKLDAAGTLAWVRQPPLQAESIALGVAANAEGDVWVVGSTGTSIVGPPNGTRDAFVARWSAAGAPAFATQLGTPTSDDEASGIALDAGDDAFVSGRTTGSLGGASGGFDGFVAKLDPLGNLL